MKKSKTVVFWILGIVIVALLIGGGAMWWFMQQPMYMPGSLAKHSQLTPPQNASLENWEVSPGITLHHYHQGNGRNILFIHGGPGTPIVEPAPAFEMLESEYKIHYYHQRGTGQSTRPITTFTSENTWENIQQLEGTLGIREQLADIERIRRILGDEKLIIIGHSYGAFLAALYAAELPDHVESMVLIAPADLLVMPSKHGGLFENLRARLPETRREAYDAWLQSYLDMKDIFTRSEDEQLDIDLELQTYWEEAMGAAPEEASAPREQIGVWQARAQYFSMGQRHDYTSALSSVSAPVLIVHGASDLQPSAVSDEYARLLPNARVVTIDGTGHFPHFTHSEALSAALLNFLRRGEPLTE